MNSVLRRRGAWVGLTAVGFIGLPIAWGGTLLGWLQYGAAAPWKWPAATLALGAMFTLLCRWLGGSAPQRVGRRALLLAAAVWLTAHFAVWQWRVSRLDDDPLIMLFYLTATGWLGWCGAMFFCRPLWRDRLKMLVALLLLLAAWVILIEAHGCDGRGRPLLAWRFGAEARAALLEDGLPGRPALARRAGSPSYESPASTPSSVEADQPATRAGATAQHDYPCFRGRDGLARIEGVRLARDWSARPPRLIWRISIGQGWGGFAVAEGLAFTQEQRGESEAVVCYDLATGEQRWVHTDAACFRSPTAGDGPRATPAVAHADVYTLGATGILNCLDVRTGRRRWSVDILADNRAGNLFHGLSGSPLVVGDAVVVSAGGAHSHSLAAYERSTGSRLWIGGDDAAGYGSPLLCRITGQRQIVILNRPGLAAHDPHTGKVLWTFPWANDQETNCSQPVPLDGDRVLVSTGYGKGCALVAIKPSSDGTWSAEPIWTSRNMKTKFSSAVAREGYAYGLDDGILTCIDLADGQRRWKAGRYGHGQVLLVGDVLLIQAESGEVVLVEATPDEHHELGRFSALEGKTWNYPALAGSLLLVRNDREAACYELPVERENAL